MKLKQRIEAFSELGKQLSTLSEDDLKLWSVNAQALNPWFTEDNVKLALEGIIQYLKKEKLNKWLSNYEIGDFNSKKIGVVMAGNIPLVGFHDYLSVLISNHHLVAKLSSGDNYLLPQIHRKLIEIEPFFSKKVDFTERLKDVDAYIATGSDNSARYFEYYFSKKPHIIRKNRTSIAVLTGKESEDELEKLCDDVFQYFGLGCRNVTFFLVPEGYKWDSFFEVAQKWEFMIDHTKYRNNYEYSRSVLLVKQIKHLDNGFMLVKEDNPLNSTISVLNYKTYKSDNEVKNFIENHKEQIQCVVGKGYLPFGSAQFPEVWDYADGVDTVEFLSKL